MYRMTPPPPTPSPASPQTSPQRQEMRRRVLILLGTVVALHAVVISIYYGIHAGERSMKFQETFIAVWVVLTLLVVTTQMKEIRKLRGPRRGITRR